MLAAQKLPPISGEMPPDFNLHSEDHVRDRSTILLPGGVRILPARQDSGGRFLLSSGSKVLPSAPIEPLFLVDTAATSPSRDLSCLTKPQHCSPRGQQHKDLGRRVLWILPFVFVFLLDLIACGVLGSIRSIPRCNGFGAELGSKFRQSTVQNCARSEMLPRFCAGDASRGPSIKLDTRRGCCLPDGSRIISVRRHTLTHPGYSASL